MTGVTTLQTILTIPSWYRDHRFGGRAILPSVEAMALLAATVKENYPGIRIDHIEQAQFPRFLELPEHVAKLEVIIELRPFPDNRLRTRLLTRKHFKTMSRLVSHCELLFGGADPPARPEPQSAPGSANSRSIETSLIYQDLVPFGPAYRSLQGRVYLYANGARATVRGPQLELPYMELGSPFCLDGSMHAACVHGQSLVDFVPFPVAFARRNLVLPTLNDENYEVEVRLQHVDDDELVYDLLLWDQTGKLRELVSGLRMRDASSGRIQPPDWIKNEW